MLNYTINDLLLWFMFKFEGREQAAMTGKRLKELDFDYTNLIHSTMTRAMETAKIIKEFLPSIPVIECSLLEEGAPIPPEPPVGHWRPAHYVIHTTYFRMFYTELVYFLFLSGIYHLVFVMYNLSRTLCLYILTSLTF